MSTADPFACAVFLILAFAGAGALQTAWFALPWSRRFASPVDGGLTFRGRRVFGENKTWRGFIVMVPATAVAFAATPALLRPLGPAADDLWALSDIEYAALGAWAGFGFMAGELPNSFIKRQIGISPGEATTGALRAWQLAGDRLDSVVGALVALSLAVSVSSLTWAVVLAVGPLVHWSFSALMCRLGLKPRTA